MAVSERAVRLHGAAHDRGGVRPARAGRRAPDQAQADRALRRSGVERQGEPADPSPPGGRGRVRVPAHGGRRARARRCAGGRAIATRSRWSRRSRISAWDPNTRIARSRTRSSRPRLPFDKPDDLPDAVADASGRRPDCLVVPGPHGIRPARVGPAKRAGEARPPEPARSAEPGAQTAGLVSAVLPEHARERCACGSWKTTTADRIGT